MYSQLNSPNMVWPCDVGYSVSFDSFSRTWKQNAPSLPLEFLRLYLWRLYKPYSLVADFGDRFRRLKSATIVAEIGD